MREFTSHAPRLILWYYIAKSLNSSEMLLPSYWHLRASKNIGLRVIVAADVL
jgi:hypothetical protein